jgi:hypothetical protein
VSALNTRPGRGRAVAAAEPEDDSIDLGPDFSLHEAYGPFAGGSPLLTTRKPEHGESPACAHAGVLALNCSGRVFDTYPRAPNASFVVPASEMSSHYPHSLLAALG